MRYAYIKKEKKRFNLSPEKRKYLAAIFFSIGVLFLFSVVSPIIQFQLEYAFKFNKLLNPVSVDFYNQTRRVLGSSTVDYNQINNWFVDNEKVQNPIKNSLVDPNTFATYSLSIPSLKIDKAVVSLGSMDLKKSLIQYPQTALPGQLGNPVIFGHSMLPQFFNPKSYQSIFSTLFRLKTGDEVFVTYDKIKYKYKIEEMYEVKPTDFSVLEQRFDNRYLTLITCSPPGTYLRRLVVKARLADN